MNFSIRKAVIDTNCLIYSSIARGRKKKIIENYISNLFKKDWLLALTEQTLLEFFSIVTNPKRVKNPVTCKRAIKEITKFYKNAGYKIIKPNLNTFNFLLKILEEKNVRGALIFDYYLAATALSNGFNIILTENTKDFKNIKGLKVINPFD